MNDIRQHPVVLLEANEKRPKQKNWSNIEISDLPTYIKRDTNKNWGIRCDHVVVVDVDAKEANAGKCERDMVKFKEDILAIDTYMVRTRSGNPHAYFALEDRMNHWKRKIGMWGFVDICTGSNSVVVAAGSTVQGVKYVEIKKGIINNMPDWLFNEINHAMEREQKEQKDEARQSCRTKRSIVETQDEILALLIQNGYEHPVIKQNKYGDYDIVYGQPHTCAITGREHDKIDGFVFKADDGELLAGCYSHHCTGKYKRLSCNTQPPELARLIDLAANHSTHHAIASVAVHLYKDNIKYVHQSGWYHFQSENGLWRYDAPGHTLRILLSTSVSDAFSKRILAYNEMIRNAISQSVKDTYDQTISKLATVIMKLGDGYQKDKLIKEAQPLLADDDLLSKMDESELLGFSNGVYDLRTLEFRKGKPEDYVSLSVGYDYPTDITDAEKQQVYNVFRAPFDTDAMADYILKTLASCLDGKRSVAEFFIWCGSGSNSKSTLQELVFSTMGAYAQPLDISLWTRPKGAAGSALPELADKRSARFTFSNEPESSDKLQVAKLKEVTGGERITARKLYGNPITYRPKFGIFILTNTLPELSKLDGGISRRIRVVPFKYQFKQLPMEGERKADPEVMYNCRNNMRWRQACMVMLLEKYKEIRNLTALPIPPEVQEASAQYLDDNNPIGRWLASHYVMTHNQKDIIKACDMYHAYCQDSEDKISITSFGVAMHQINDVPRKMMRVGGSTSNYYIGIKRRLRVENDDEIDLID